MNGLSMNGFRKTLAGSIVLHAALIGAAALLYASGANRVFITPVYTVDLVSQGPKQAMQAAPPAPPVAAPESEPVKTETPEPVKPVAQKAAAAVETVKIKTKPSVNEALKKIEKKVEKRNEERLVASSIDSLKQKMEAERRSRNDRVAKLKDEISSRNSTAGPVQAIKPAVPVAAANTATGAGAPKASLEAKYPAYYGLIRDKVQENWIYPEGLKDNRISVIVSIKIARTGRLLDVSVEKSSGDAAFDISLLKAVKKAAPFPPLPVDMEGSFLETGLRFCPGCAQ